MVEQVSDLKSIPLKQYPMSNRDEMKEQGYFTQSRVIIPKSPPMVIEYATTAKIVE